MCLYERGPISGSSWSLTMFSSLVTLKNLTTVLSKSVMWEYLWPPLLNSPTLNPVIKNWPYGNLIFFFGEEVGEDEEGDKDSMSELPKARSNFKGLC